MRAILVAHYFKEEVSMRELSPRECTDVVGGIRVVMVVGGVIAWAFANRADLMEIGQAAKQRHEELNAEH